MTIKLNAELMAFSAGYEARDRNEPRTPPAGAKGLYRDAWLEGWDGLDRLDEVNNKFLGAPHEYTVEDEDGNILST